LKFDDGRIRIRTNVNNDVVLKTSSGGCSFIGPSLQVFEQYIYILKKREGELLTRLEAIHTVKFQTLEEQQQQLRYTVPYMTVSC
jgi:hypothetical protein